MKPPSLFFCAALGLILPAMGCGKVDGSGPSKVSGEARCEAPLTDCGGHCTDIAEDADHCGACGRACPEGDVCLEGVCGSTGCPAGRHDCGGICVDQDDNPLHCGGCDAPCTGMQTCIDGSCACEAPARLCNGVCTAVLEDPRHCGACGNSCAPDEACADGSCEPICPPGTSLCGDRCADLSIDPTACGDCSTACSAPEVCSGGQCVCPEDEAHAKCGGRCVDLQNDPEHCGACGNACGAGMYCRLGTCTACRDGFFFCPSPSGNPLQTCLAQASDASQPVDSGKANEAGAGPEPLTVDLACQCNHCLAELQDCVDDSQCTATWQCAVQNACTVPCWGTMGICPLSSTSGGCFKFCAPSTGSTQTATRAEALLRCTMDNGCGI